MRGCSPRRQRCVEPDARAHAVPNEDYGAVHPVCVTCRGDAVEVSGNETLRGAAPRCGESNERVSITHAHHPKARPMRHAYSGQQSKYKYKYTYTYKYKYKYKYNTCDAGQIRNKLRECMIMHLTKNAEQGNHTSAPTPTSHSNTGSDVRG